jgi:uncharacterized protein (DUF58 family)
MFAALKTKFNLQRFFVGEGPLQTPYLLTQRRVYILPTKQGLAFAVLLFVMLLGSINYSNSLGYLITFLLASLSVVTIFHTYNNLLKLSFGPAVCIPSFAEEDAEFNVQVNNLHMQKRFSVQAFTPQKIITLTDIPENRISTITIKHCFHKRGLIDLPRFTVESRFPFGLFRTWAIIQLDQSQLVYPKPSADKALPLKNAGSSEGKKQLDIGTDDFKSLRTYTAGDPLQHIHWKNFARHQSLHTKEFSSTTADDLWLSWSETTPENIERKLSQLTQWALLADKNNLRYGLILPDSLVQPNIGKQHLSACLKQLALYGLNALK